MDGTYDYVVVGSGAGGGPLAANLALEGFHVLLLEAGGETDGPVYRTPAFHGQATEDEEMRWDYYVRHFEDEVKQSRNFNYDSGHKGIWYPRAATLGGCTAHNAMITIAPPDSDWDHIADVTGDESWRGDRMRRYFTHLEQCRYRRRRWLNEASSGHGFSGWLSTEVADARPGLRDSELLKLLYTAVRGAAAEGAGNTWLRLLHEFDPNDRELWRRSPSGISATPLATDRGRRTGPREYLKRVAERCPNLTIKTRALVTRIVLDGDRRAAGVEYVEGDNLYRASPRADPTQPLPERRTVLVTREAIVCAGAFNSPQLLMLSGIGPGDELRAHGIETRVDLRGVGKNLQDHYEISVVGKMRREFSVLRGAGFSEHDSAYGAWVSGKGIYTSNGVVLGILFQSSVANPKDGPDVYIFGAPTDFRGYAHGYSKRLTAELDRFTWVVLKARTGPAGGRVSLESADPRFPPRVDFAYFPEGDPGAARDLAAMGEGLLFVERINRRMGKRFEARIWPPPEVQSPQEIGQFIQDHAWGHHASCTNRMGPQGNPASVVDSRFRVYGTKGLRVVDASVFPRIPGHFISAAIYIISEKAVDDILEDAGRGRRV